MMKGVWHSLPSCATKHWPIRSNRQPLASKAFAKPNHRVGRESPIMAFSFPADLARVVTERWTAYVNRGSAARPPLPSTEKLQELFEAIFFASLEHEEGRSLHFSVVYTETYFVDCEDNQGQVHVVPFLNPRPLTVEALRSLAPAARPDGAAIGVRPALELHLKGRLEITGILHVGSEYARARAGKSFVHRNPPYALVIEVRGAGELHVYQGKVKLAVLESGTIRTPVAVSTMEFSPAADIVAEGEQGLWSRITPPKHEPAEEWLSFQSMALLNTVLNIVNTIKTHGHGGTLLLVSPSSLEHMPVKVKYESNLDINFLDDEFVDFINARNVYMDAMILNQDAAHPSHKKDEHIHLLPPLIEADRSLCDAAETIAAFSCVDGALVMSAALRLVGFGAEILLEKAPPAKVFQVAGNPIATAEHPELDSEGFGMRHRSAVRFVAATPAAVAFIVSQDGKVSFCWKKRDKTYLKRGVNTSNPNMAGA